MLEKRHTPRLKSEIETVLNDAVSFHEFRSEDVMDPDAAMYSILMTRELCAGIAGLDAFLNEDGHTFVSEARLDAICSTVTRFVADLEGTSFPLMRSRASGLLLRISAAFDSEEGAA